MSIEAISEKHSLANDPPDEPTPQEQALAKKLGDSLRESGCDLDGNPVKYFTAKDIHALAETMIEEELAKGKVYGTDRVECDARIQALEDFIRRLEE